MARSGVFTSNIADVSWSAFSIFPTSCSTRASVETIQQTSGKTPWVHCSAPVRSSPRRLDTWPTGSGGAHFPGPTPRTRGIHSRACPARHRDPGEAWTFRYYCPSGASSEARPGDPGPRTARHGQRSTGPPPTAKWPAYDLRHRLGSPGGRSSAASSATSPRQSTGFVFNRDIAATTVGRLFHARSQEHSAILRRDMKPILRGCLRIKLAPYQCPFIPSTSDQGMQIS